MRVIELSFLYICIWTHLRISQGVMKLMGFLGLSWCAKCARSQKFKMKFMLCWNVRCIVISGASGATLLILTCSWIPAQLWGSFMLSWVQNGKPSVWFLGSVCRMPSCALAYVCSYWFLTIASLLLACIFLVFQTLKNQDSLILFVKPWVRRVFFFWQ